MHALRLALLAMSFSQMAIAPAAISQTRRSDTATASDRVRFFLIQSGGGLGVDLEDNATFYSAGPGLSGPWFLQRSRTETNCLRRRAPQNPCPKTSISEEIDGGSCPALQRVMAELMPIRKRERGSAHSMPSDTPLLSLVTIQYGLMGTDRLSEYEGPLVDWWQAAQEQLKSCWRVRGHG
jgi:hypothetical protein